MASTQIPATGKVVGGAIEMDVAIPPFMLTKHAYVEYLVSSTEDDEPASDGWEPTGQQATIDPETGELRSVDATLWEPNAPISSKPNRLSPAQMTRLNILGVDVYGKRWDVERPQLVSEVSIGAYTSAKELTPQEASVLIKQLETELKHARNGKVPA
jgi:hypothetical protein